MVMGRSTPWRRLAAGVSFLILGALLVGAGTTMLVPNAGAQADAPVLREVGVIADPDEALTSSLADCSDVAALQPGELSAVEDGQKAYVINGEPSEARYVVEEELAGIGANTAIGRTNAFIGQILLDDANMPVTCSRFDVDMRTLVSDESRRDNFLRGNTLQSDSYPVATFILRTVEGLDGGLSSEEQTFTLIGDLVFRGQTQLVAWEATASLNGDNLSGSAFTSFLLEDYNIEKPIVGSVVSIADDLRLEVDIEASAN
ncbi:MAG: YceI family protein [Thermomicrobiales bacterium]